MAWFNECYSRILVDNHISEFDPSFMASFDPAGYAGQMKKAGVDASMIYASDHNGNCYFPTVVGHMHTGLKGRDIFGETVECVLNEGIVPLAYHSVVFFNQSAWEHPSWRTELPGGSQHGGRYWFCCPNSEEYREFCRIQCAEVLHYPVQGIFIDMVFWPGICSCHNCREKYLRETGREIPTVIQWDTNEWVEFQRARERWMGEFAEFLQHAEIEIGEGHVLAEFHVAAGMESPAGMARDDDGKVVVIVAVTIGKAAAVNEHRVLQQPLAIHIGGFF